MTEKYDDPFSFDSEKIRIGNRICDGFYISAVPAPLLMIRAPSGGFLMCGYLDMAAAEKLGASAAKVKGVSSFEEMLDAEVADVSPAAEEKGVSKGMTGREALRFL